jgi:hypothetical protein
VLWGGSRRAGLGDLLRAVAIAGLFVGYRAGREQRKQELRLEEVRRKRDFFHGAVRPRLTTYSHVWRTLGVVTDVPLGDGNDRYEALLADPEALRSAMTKLYKHLYGEAGLLMDL